MQNFLRLFKIKETIFDIFGYSVEQVEALPQSGSPRAYSRVWLSNGESMILCQSADTEENRVFFQLDRVFFDNGLNVPGIYYFDPDGRWYLQQDAGRISLLDIIREVRAAKTAEELAKKAEEKDVLERVEALDKRIRECIGWLVRFQTLPEEQWSGKVGFPPLGRELIFFDFNYCIRNFFEVSEIEYDAGKLEEELEKLCCRLLAYPSALWGFMYRDFQSRNVMLDSDSNPTFIDFQSGRKGPGIYDIVSFLWQAKAGFSMKERSDYLAYYAELMGQKVESARDVIFTELPYWCCFRLMQVLGAYGNRGLREGKGHFIESIPPALDNFIELIKDYRLDSDFPVLSSIIADLNRQWKKKRIN